MKMKTMSSGVFKTNSLAVMGELKAQRESVIVTKHGQPVAMPVPVKTVVDDIFGFLSREVEKPATWFRPSSLS